jgi:hypothetical protein
MQRWEIWGTFGIEKEKALCHCKVTVKCDV